MVISHKHNFQELFEACSKSLTLNLPTLKENLVRISYEKSDDLSTVYNGLPPPLPFARSEIFQTQISNSRRLTSVNGDCKAVYEVTFDITGSNFTFKPGDTIGIIPHNDDASVNFILSHLDLISQADLPYHLSCDTSQKLKLPQHIPVRCTLRNVLKNIVDLRSILKKLFLLSLSRHTKDENERKVLEFLCSKEGSTSYTSHILNKSFCILDLLSVFKSCKPPIEILLTNLPRLLPRPYSIVNSYLKHPNLLKICFSVMDFENNRKGLTSGWLERLVLEDSNIESKMENLSLYEKKTVPIYLRKNITAFSMPENLETPLILIGPGTGIAPFIGFLEERQYLKETKDVNLGNVWVFFGCRNPKLDFIYEKELQKYLDNGILTKLSTSFSRVDNNNVKYVQDTIQENAEELVEWIHKGASIFVCGDVKTMVAEVKKAIETCLIRHSPSDQDAATLLSDLIREKRYLVDIWN
ncbi:methionine synthase reductase [Amyelois transitella]|uniref:methionine synthase reductase n=1 Tax=Amyelois transitella TaxID=680683 RepID=UPI00298FCFFF|nr:methionine synthase reductase [Amyelois transitella]